MCRAICKAKKCHFKNVLEKMPELDHNAVGGVVDIEELVSWATEKSVCPYYLGSK